MLMMHSRNTVKSSGHVLAVDFLQLAMAIWPIELGGIQIFKIVWYFIKYHGINNYSSPFFCASISSAYHFRWCLQRCIKKLDVFPSITILASSHIHP